MMNRPGVSGWGRRAAVTVCAVMAGAIVGGCSGSGSTEVEETMDEETRPAMEEILADYEQMQAEMFAALGAELGAKPWGRAPNDDIGPVRSGCGAVEDGEAVTMVVQYVEGTYDPADWHRAVEVVQDVGRSHGFTETGTVVDTADDIEVYGVDTYGGKYVFGMAVNSILTITTGCHAWAAAPAQG